MTQSTLKKQVIRFDNGNESIAVYPAAGSSNADIVNALDLKPYKAVILVIGGADGLEKTHLPRLIQLFGRGIARAATASGALVIDGATQSGVAALMGEALAAREDKGQLLGIAPSGLISLPGAGNSGVALEPNHTHFVLTEGTAWGSETATMFRLVDALSKQDRQKGSSLSHESKAGKLPSLAILSGGGSGTLQEVLKAVRQGLKIVVVQGTGGIADEVATAWRDRQTLPDDPVMAEIVADGEIHLHALSNSVKGMERLIVRELGVDKVLMQAWETFADYDYNSVLQQKQFQRIQLTIIIIGVVSTALVVIEQVFAPREADHALATSTIETDTEGNLTLQGGGAWWIIRHLLILSPILLTVLLTVVSRFKQGSKWLLLRAGAESIKREIFRYRTRAQDYKDEPEQQLAKKIEDITRRTMRTEVNMSALVPYPKEKGFPPYMFAARGGDDGFTFLTPDRYVEVRLGDQLTFYQRKAVKMAGLLKWLYWLTFIIGGIGTYLAAVNQQVWIALTTSIAAALGTYLGYRQTENTLMKYNQAATDLANVKSWWNALSAEEQAQQDNIDSLVHHTELVLQSELDGWVQQMQNALADLRKSQEEKQIQSAEERPISARERRAADVEAAVEEKPVSPTVTASNDLTTPDEDMPGPPAERVPETQAIDTAPAAGDETGGQEPYSMDPDTDELSAEEMAKLGLAEDGAAQDPALQEDPDIKNRTS